MKSWLLLCGLLFASGALAGETGQAPFLWSVKHEGTTHYLMGSVHLLPDSAYPLPKELLDAYEHTKGLVLEADLQDLSAPSTQAMILNGARATGPGGIQAVIGDKLYGKLQARAAELGAPGPMCDPFRAWFCALTLELFTLQRAGFNPERGIDHYFHSKAREDGRPVRGLETAEEHVGLFVNMSEELSVAMLAATLEELTSGSREPEEIFRMWRESDLDAVGKMAGEMRTRYPKFHERLLAGRNRVWMPRLQGILGSEVSQLVIVGAAHLPSKDGLLALLAEAGFEAVPVMLSATSEETQAPKSAAPREGVEETAEETVEIE